MSWNRKLLVFTWHFKEEFDRLKKPLNFVLDILENGRHIQVGKRENKYNVFYPGGGKQLCLSYVEQEVIIMIHVKPIRWKI
ncbi:MAG: hypothetical protein ABIF10_02965 [Candidatus Woesearchaeota archaeon]